MGFNHASPHSAAKPILADTHLFEQYFDPDWYLAAYADVKNYAQGPQEHYLRFGFDERRAPHPLFDLNWYLARHPEVAEAGVEPLSHYFSHGWRQLHAPHPLFDPAWYLLQNTDILSADIDPLRHYLKHGWAEGRSLHPLFDTAWYLDVYRDVAQQGTDPLSHFLTSGWRAGRRPHPLFDTAWYLKQYDDIAKAGLNPWLHYIRSGWREGRAPHPCFDAPWYIRHYLDEVNLNCEPLSHYLAEGWREGLLPSPRSRPVPDRTGDAAPLYRQVIDELAKTSAQGPLELSKQGNRGTVVLVVHETEVGGAPHVLKLFALWLRDRTRFDVRIVALRGGNLRHAFAKVAPLLVLTDHPDGEHAELLREWMCGQVRGVFVNSIASGGILKYLPAGLPVVAFIHELPKVLDLFPAEVDLIRTKTDRVIAVGPNVKQALQTEYGFDPEKLVSVVSFIEALPRDTDYAQRRATARSVLTLPEERLVVMGCGTVHWRKAPDKFIETAELVLRRGIDAEFVWVGGGPDLEACQALAVEKGLDGRVRFTGYEPDAAAHLAAADVFLLSSQEDPFPLVALEAAQMGVPIICFRKAGGMEGFVGRGSGVAVPFMNVPAMAEAVAAYALNPQRRANDGQTGRQQVERSHVTDVVGPILLHHFREVMQLKPEVSVVVPNYNYEDYLPERLSTIAGQTFQDFEVILLDDASPDNSVQLLEAFARRRPGTRVVVNNKNSGSPFVQWMRGMDLAQSGLIWLAEADDRCKPTFLQTLLPMFDDRNVRIACCASQPVTSDGAVIGDYRPLYLDRITPGRWDRDYLATDHEEANAGLGIANSIPNASAVIVRKFRPEPEFAQKLTDMRLCGDWYFYVRAMRGGLVGFSAALLNDHRRHVSTVTHRLEGSLRYFSELATVRAYLGRTYRQNPQTQARIAEFLAQDIVRFKIANPETLPQVPAQAKALPSLLMVAPDLSPGGGQVFAISVANEWARRGGRVVLLNVANQPSHPAMLARIAPEVTLLDASQPGCDLGTLIERFDLDVIHSGIWWADRWVDNNRKALPDDMPWVITMHGCHETILAEPGIDPGFSERIARMIKRAAWVYIAGKNLAVFDVHGLPDRIVNIPNGVADKKSATSLTRWEVGLRPDAVVLCLASRAIPEKGWFEAVEVVQRLNAEGHAVDLLLLGEGPAEVALRQKALAHVHIMGQVEDPQAYFGLVDIGVLPSYFVGESLPLVLIEMMAKSLPLIASEIGEIPNLVGEGDNAAGLLVPLVGGRLVEEALHAAVSRLVSDAELRSVMGRTARKHYEEKLTITGMLDQYVEVYGQSRHGCQTIRWHARPRHEGKMVK